MPSKDDSLISRLGPSPGVVGTPRTQVVPPSPSLETPLNPVSPGFIGSPAQDSNSAATAGEQDSDVLDEKNFNQQPSEYYTPPKPLDIYNNLKFPNALEFGDYIHPLLNSGATILHDWQVEYNLFIDSPKWTSKNPLELYLVAANGSGKDAWCIALQFVYRLCCKVRSRTVITTRDFKQMMNQTYYYIKILSEMTNKRLIKDGFTKTPFINVVQGHITCAETGSDIVMFVTDEPGRAEGYHPFPDHPDSELNLVVNEAKSVEKEIFQALRRCTGYSRYICISSAGFDSGYFYDQVQRSVKFPEAYQSFKPYSRTITAYDCPHIPKQEIENRKNDLEPWLFESIYLSVFSSVGGCFAVPRYLINALKDLKITHNDNSIECGLDLSLGGDETVFIKRTGPNITASKSWRIKDTNRLEDEIIIFIEELDLPLGTRINVDVGGLGKPIYQHLRRKGGEFNFIPISNNSPAINKTLFKNTGIEDYFHIRTLTIRKAINYPKIPILIDQLAGRRYEEVNGKLKLEDKADARTRGDKSPDWADSYVLAFRRYRFTEFNKLTRDKSELEEDLGITTDFNHPDFDLEKIIKVIDNQKSFNPNGRTLNYKRILNQSYGRSSNQLSWINARNKR